MRPLFAAAGRRARELMAEAGAGHYLRKTGWLKLYRSDESFAATAHEREIAEHFEIPSRVLDPDGVRALEPSLDAGGAARIALGGGGEHQQSARADAGLCGAVHRAAAASCSSAMRARCTAPARRWRVDTAEGPVEAPDAVVALGPWAPDLLAPLGIRLPMAVKRGYHRHFRARGNADLTRPVLDAENGYCLAPMEQGIRLTHRRRIRRSRRGADAGAVRSLDAGGARAVSARRAGRGKPWMGSRPCFRRFAAGDRPGAGAGRPVARLRACPLGPDARRGHRPAGRRSGDKNGAGFDPAPFAAERLRADAVRSIAGRP